MSHYIKYYFVFAFVFANLIFAQKGQYVTIKPEKPKIGDEITVTYNATAMGAILQDNKEMNLESLLIPESGTPELVETKMEKKGQLWIGSFKLTNDKTRLILFRMITGEKTDDNGNDSWNKIVYGKNKKPLEGAQYQLSQVLFYGESYDFKVKIHKEEAKKQNDQERKLYPNNLSSIFFSWRTMLREQPGEETKQKIKLELNKLYENCKNDDKKVIRLLKYFEAMNQNEKKNEIINSRIAIDPTGEIAEYVFSEKINNENDKIKKIELIKEHLNTFHKIDDSKKDIIKGMMLSLLIETKQYDRAFEFFDSMPKKSAHYYNSLSWPLIEKGEQLERAVEWAKIGISSFRNPNREMKPSYLSEKMWKKGLERGLSFLLDTYAYGLFQLGSYIEAEKNYEEAFNLSKGSNSSANERYIECLIKNEKYPLAVEVSEKCIVKGEFSDKLIGFYKTAYIKVNGSDFGFNEIIENIKNKIRNELISKTRKEMVDKPAPDFNLKGLDGKFVKLSDLKGKIVVLDFWATWCGPCKASFPALQKFYEKYKNDPNIAILTLDTWEKEKGEEKEKNVKKFIEENKYTFTVLFDEDYVSKYEVTGIPTKFIIDKKGKIRFITVGYHGELKMLEDLELQLEILLGKK